MSKAKEKARKAQNQKEDPFIPARRHAIIANELPGPVIARTDPQATTSTSRAAEPTQPVILRWWRWLRRSRAPGA